MGRTIQQEIRVPVWWRKMTRREREVMQRVLERHARELVEKWDAEDASVRPTPHPNVFYTGKPDHHAV